MQKLPYKLWLIMLLAIAALAAGMGAYYYYSARNDSPKPILTTKINGTVFPQSRVLSAFSLNAGGKNFTNADLKGHWSLIFFGFTNCPVICPTTLALINQAYLKLQTEHFQPLPQVVFVSVDPERDTAERVKQYAAGFNANFIGVTGDDEQLAQLASDLSAVYMKVELAPAKRGDKKAYTIDHSIAVMVIDPAGHLHAILSSPENGDTFAQDYQAAITKIKSQTDNKF